MENLKNAIIIEMSQLLEKVAVDSFVPVITEAVSQTDQREALVHTQALMNKYNIQIDELLESIKPKYI